MLLGEVGGDVIDEAAGSYDEVGEGHGWLRLAVIGVDHGEAATGRRVPLRRGPHTAPVMTRLALWE